MQYKRNFLTQVVARSDFAVQIGLHESMPQELKTAFRAILPVIETRQVKFGEMTVHLESAEVASTIQEGIEWNFHSEDRTSRIAIGPDFLLVTCSKYTRFEHFSGIFDQAVALLLQHLGDRELRRFGMRFVNQVKLEGGEPTDWAGAINAKLTALLDVPLHSPKMNRAMAVVESNYDEFNVRFQYGMPNPDFPAPIRQRLFVLDYDAYTPSAVALGQAVELSDKCNKRIHELFEDSIDDGLRALMNADA